MAFTMYASGISPVSHAEDDAMNRLIRINISIPASWKKAHYLLFWVGFIGGSTNSKKISSRESENSELYSSINVKPLTVLYSSYISIE